MYFYYSNHRNFMRLLRFARNDTPFCHCEESALADDEAIYFFAELIAVIFFNNLPSFNYLEKLTITFRALSPHYYLTCLCPGGNLNGNSAIPPGDDLTI